MRSQFFLRFSLYGVKAKRAVAVRTTPVPCSQTVQRRLWCRNSFATVTRESHWEYTAMWLETSSGMRLKTVQHASLSTGRIRSIVVECLLLLKTLRNAVKTQCLVGAVGIETTTRPAKRSGASARRNVDGHESSNCPSSVRVLSENYCLRAPC